MEQVCGKLFNQGCLFVCTGEHRAVVRSAKGPKQIHDLLGLSRERISEIQSQVDSFVTRGLELLQIERDAELEATHQSLEGASSAIGAPPITSAAVQKDRKDEEALEQCDSITNLMAVGSTTGLMPHHFLISSLLKWLLCHSKQ